MAISAAHDVQKQLTRFLSGQLRLDELEAWLVSVTWHLDRDLDPEGAELAAEITLRLSEFSQGYWTAEELREWLKLIHAMGHSLMSCADTRTRRVDVRIADSPWVAASTSKATGVHPPWSTRHIGATPLLASPEVQFSPAT